MYVTWVNVSVTLVDFVHKNGSNIKRSNLISTCLPTIAYYTERDIGRNDQIVVSYNNSYEEIDVGMEIENYSKVENGM